MAIVTTGIDLTKNGFAAHGVDEAGKAGRCVRPHLLVSYLRACQPISSPTMGEVFVLEGAQR